MTSGRITHAARDGVHVLRYIGSVNYTLAPGLQRFIETIIHDGATCGLIFDLTLAESVDSTNLGLMARANEELRGSGAKNSMIVSNNEDIDDVLKSMGFDRSFELVTSSDAAPVLSDEAIDAEPCSARELQRTMIDAHRALMRLSEAGRLEFEPVVACLERDLSSNRA